MRRPPSTALVLVVLAPLVSHAGDNVGPETCRACHPAAYDAWLASPHARARETLPERSRSEPRCLSCHAPDAEDGLPGVSCETCHGGGRVYAAPYVMRDAELARAVGLLEPGPRTCSSCHTESTPSLVRFEYERKLALIEHWDKGPLATPPPRPAAAPAPRKAR